MTRSSSHDRVGTLRQIVASCKFGAIEFRGPMETAKLTRSRFRLSVVGPKRRSLHRSNSPRSSTLSPQRCTLKDAPSTRAQPLSVTGAVHMLFSNLHSFTVSRAKLAENRWPPIARVGYRRRPLSRATRAWRRGPRSWEEGRPPSNNKTITDGGDAGTQRGNTPLFLCLDKGRRSPAKRDLAGPPAPSDGTGASRYTRIMITAQSRDFGEKRQPQFALFHRDISHNARNYARNCVLLLRAGSHPPYPSPG
jgi:hypothetical protein